MDELQAPELDYLLESDPRYRVYTDPHEFFARTLVMENMLGIVEGVVSALRGAGPRVFVLYSFFGGGKTHTLFAVYHALRDPDAFWKAVRESAESLPPGERIRFVEHGRRVVKELRSLGQPKVVVVSGKIERFFPSPSRPQRVNGVLVHTLWGYLGALLGRYELVREEDESGRAPKIDRLVELLRGSQAVILADEVAEGIADLYRSRSNVDKDYALQLVSFFDNLFSAATRSNVAIIFTLPGERAAGEIVWESRYHDVQGLLDALVKAIRRVNAALLEPVSSGEFWRILRRRLFRRIDEEHAQRLSAELRSVYEEQHNVFGGATDYAEKTRLMYPLHPGFVEAVRTIIERNPRLQKTRDALKIARRIMRLLYEREKHDGVDEDMVMAWHIDPAQPELSMMLAGYDSYKVVVDADLVKNVGRLGERSELARIIATTVFVLTYTYQSPRSLSVFPTRARIAALVYDPALFQARRWLPSDIAETIEELQRSLYYLWSDGERYWFWDIANVNQMIEQRAQELVQRRGPQLLEELTGDNNYLGGLVSRKLSQKRGLGQAFRPRLFEDYLVLVQPELDYVPDDDKYKLVVAWRPPSEGFEKLITHTVRGGQVAPRIYQNTVVVLAPGSSELEERAIQWYARVKAAEAVENEIDALLQGASGLHPDLRNAVRKIQATMIRDARADAETRLLEELLNGFDQVYYPRAGAYGASVERVDVSRLGVTALCLAEKAETTLERESKAILSGPVSFDYLLQKLEEAGLSLEEPTTLREILGAFRTRPGLPMVPVKLVVDALMDGFREGKLVVRRSNGSVAFVRMRRGDCTDAEGQVERLERIGEDDEVVLAGSPKGAEILLRYLEGLEGQETRPDGSIIVRSVRVELEGSVLGLREFTEVAAEEPSLVESAVFCLVEEQRRPGVRLRVSPQRLQLLEGQSTEIRVNVEPVGDLDPGQVALRVEAVPGVEAKISPDTVASGDTAILRLTVTRPGVYHVKVEAIPEHGDSDTVVVEVNVKGSEVIVDCEKLEEHGGVVKGLMLGGVWDGVEAVISDIARDYPEASATASMENEKAEIRMAIDKPKRLDIAAEIMRSFATTLRDLMGMDTRIRARIVIEFPESVDVYTVRHYTGLLFGDVVCKARVARR